MKHIRTLALATIAIVGCGVHHSIAQEPSGEAVAVIQSTSVEDLSGNRPLEANGPVFAGDLVKTDQAGRAQLLFRDETRLVVGPNSEVTIDRFLFTDQLTAREIAINAIRGTLRFITGKSGHQAYTINTPTASIGVRGTAFDLTVEPPTPDDAPPNDTDPLAPPDGATSLALYDGSVRMCDTTGPQLVCAELSGQCSVTVLAPNGTFRDVDDVFERTEFMETVFPFAFQQSDLLADFQVPSRECEIRRIPDEACPIERLMPGGTCCPEGERWNGRSCGSTPPPKSNPPRPPASNPTPPTHNPPPPPTNNPPARQTCPPGTIGVPPLCISTPKCPPNTRLVRGSCVPTKTPGPSLRLRETDGLKQTLPNTR